VYLPYLNLSFGGGVKQKGREEERMGGGFGEISTQNGQLV